MVCRKCGSDVPADAETCPNCGAEQRRSSSGEFDEQSARFRSITSDLKTVDGEASRIAEPGDDVADRFQIREFVDAGPFAEVYRADDSVIEADVALKVFEEKILRNSSEEEAFFEATRTARSMTQENIVRVHDVGLDAGHPWVSMQYLEGLSLAKTLELREEKGEQFELEEIESIVEEITLGLQHVAREHPHGDLKPSNIFLLPEVLKITDGFVMSAVPEDVFADRQSEDPYLAPELFNAVGQVDVRSDVYSMGVLIGQMAFGRDYSPGSTVIEDDGTERAALDSLCRRATAFDPTERYATVEELSEDVSTLVDTGQLLHAGPRGGARSRERPASTGEGPGGRSPVDRSSDVSEGADSEQRGVPLGEVPEEEIATQEYDRDGADHSDLPEPSTSPSGAVSASAPTEEYDRAADVPGSSAGGTDEGGDGPPTGGSDESGSDEEPDRPIGVVLFAVVILLAAGVLVWTQSTSRETVTIEDEPETKAQTVTEDTGTEDTGPSPEAVTAAVDDARTASSEAVGGASEAADEEGEKLAEEREEEEESGAGAAARRGGGRAAQEPPSAQGTDCPGGMALLERDSGNYCIDRYEYPGKGQKPAVGVTWFEAKKKCRKQGKRLCTMAEWGRACGGTYPYGSQWDPSACNTQDRDGFPRQLAASGEFDQCKSWPGTYDMVGNVFEWVEEQKIVGGAFGSGREQASCNYSSRKSPGSGAPNIGFRCCARPE